MVDELEIVYDEAHICAKLSSSPVSFYTTWFQQLLRLLVDTSDDTVSSVSGVISTPWWAFLQVKYEIGAIIHVNGVLVKYSNGAKTQITLSKTKEKEISSQQQGEIESEDKLNEVLAETGWNHQDRKLKPYQVRNILHLGRYTAAATFSVPGAGKTSEALAYFLIKSGPESKLLVISPKNAFLSWDEQIQICFGTENLYFTRLTGGMKNIRQLLGSDSKYFIITYQQFPRVVNDIAQYLHAHDVLVFLDESHRIKSGRGKVIADSVLRISHLPKYKLILSGTPMPQSAADLVSQFQFLYPDVRVDEESVKDKFKNVFVRTTKEELNLPPVNRYLVPVPFGQAQQRLYNMLISDAWRNANECLSAQNKRALRKLGKSVMRLIEAASNPALLLNDISFLDSGILSEVLNEGSSSKLIYACERARWLAKRNRKCIIWTTFRNNVEVIAQRLIDLNAVYIHGGVDTGEDDDNDTREGKIKRFKNDDNCYVLVANPAAAAESISLHMVCHHAIYVDRTYNAAHYLQSEDRIHRLGLPPDTETTIEILSCPGSIDENINGRLAEKVKEMATALDDRSLSIETIRYDIGDNPEQDIEYMDAGDIASLLDWLKSKI